MMKMCSGSIAARFKAYYFELVLWNAVLFQSPAGEEFSMKKWG